MKMKNKIKMSFLGTLTLCSLTSFADSPVSNPFTGLRCTLSPWEIEGGKLSISMIHSQNNYGQAVASLRMKVKSKWSNDLLDGSWKTETISSHPGLRSSLNGFLRISFEGTAIDTRRGKGNLDLAMSFVVSGQKEMVSGSGEITFLDSGKVQTVYAEDCSLE